MATGLSMFGRCCRLGFDANMAIGEKASISFPNLSTPSESSPS